MAFPIYQQTERMQYPDASSMVVNWAGAADKIINGITQGVELGLKIKAAKEDSALNAARIRQIDESIGALKVNTDLAQARDERERAIHQLQSTAMLAENQMKYSEVALATDSLKQKQQLNMAQRQLRAMTILDMHQDASDYLLATTKNLDIRMAQTLDPSERQALLDDYAGAVQDYESTIGMSVDKLKLDLPQGDGRAAVLDAFNPMKMQGAYISNMKVPMMTSVIKLKEPTDMGGEDGEYPGMGGVKETQHSISMIPLQEAKMYWLNGQGLETFRSLEANAKNPDAFKKWATTNGLGKLLSVGAPASTEATSAAPIPETPGQERGEKVAVTVAGKKVQIDRPTGILGGVRTKVTAGSTWDSIYAGSPVGKMKKKLDILNPMRIGDQGLELGPEFTFAQDKEFREKNLSYFIEKKKAMQESMKGQSPDQRAVTSRVIDRTQLYINRLKRDYGVEGDLGDESATNVAAKVTGADRNAPSRQDPNGILSRLPRLSKAEAEKFMADPKNIGKAFISAETGEPMIVRSRSGR